MQGQIHEDHGAKNHTQRPETRQVHNSHHFPHTQSPIIAPPSTSQQPDLFQNPNSMSNLAPHVASDRTAAGGARVLKVSTTSQPKSVAGSVAHITRAGDPPHVTAVGAASSNQAIKAIAIARKYLEAEGIDIGVQIKFTRDETINHNLILTVLKFPLKMKLAEGGDVTDIKVKRDSDPSKTAGAIAGKAREGSRITVSCIQFGADAVYCAVEAISIAGQYLVRDSLSLTVFPEFVHVTTKEGERSALHFDLVVSPL